MSDETIKAYNMTTFPSEHSTPNQEQGPKSAASSSLFQPDKTPKGSLSIPSRNFNNANPAKPQLPKR